jgi:outer membrane protein assembly factor BamB
VLIGGRDGATVLGSVELYPSAVAPVGSNASLADPRYLHTATKVGDRIYVIGGFTTNEDILASIEVYAVNAATSRLAWSTAISEPYPASNCLSASVFNAKSDRLYIASGEWQKTKGTLVAMDAATGKVIWRLALPAPAIGSLSLDGEGLLAVPVFGDASVVFADAKTGHLLGQVNANHDQVFAQPVFSDQYLFVATIPGILYAYRGGS